MIHKGDQVELRRPYYGYHRGVVVGTEGYQYVVEFSSGMQERFYEDELIED